MNVKGPPQNPSVTGTVDRRIPVCRLLWLGWWNRVSCRQVPRLEMDKALLVQSSALQRKNKRLPAAHLLQRRFLGVLASSLLEAEELVQRCSQHSMGPASDLQCAASLLLPVISAQHWPCLFPIPPFLSTSISSQSFFLYFSDFSLDLVFFLCKIVLMSPACQMALSNSFILLY